MLEDFFFKILVIWVRVSQNLVELDFVGLFIFVLLRSFIFFFMLFFFVVGKLCIEVSSTSKIAFLSEELCIGCGICVKVYSFFHGRVKNCIFSLHFVDLGISQSH